MAIKLLILSLMVFASCTENVTDSADSENSANSSEKLSSAISSSLSSSQINISSENKSSNSGISSQTNSGLSVSNISSSSVQLPTDKSYFLLNGVAQKFNFTCTAALDPITKDSLVGFISFTSPSVILSTNVLNGTETLTPGKLDKTVCTVTSSDGIMNWHSNYNGSSGECEIKVESGKRLFKAHVIAAQPLDSNGLKADIYVQHECP